jgi:hypothetical protein
LRRDAVTRGQPDQQILKKPQVAVEIASTLREVEDWVADELAGTVKSGLAATVSFEHRVGEILMEAGAVARASDCVDGIVLEEDEGFLTSSSLKLGDKVFLEREGGFERHPARSEDSHRSAESFAV